jgi:hypothetical protein
MKSTPRSILALSGCLLVGCHLAQADDLLGGRYVTQEPVSQNILDLIDEVKVIRNATSPSEALKVYTSGRVAAPQGVDSNGDDSSSSNTLSLFQLTPGHEDYVSNVHTKNHLEFYRYLHALDDTLLLLNDEGDNKEANDRDSNFLDGDEEDTAGLDNTDDDEDDTDAYSSIQYADTLIRHFLENSKFHEAADAAVSLVIWLEITRLLRDTYTPLCSHDLSDDDDKDANINSLDSALALYVGQASQTGDLGGFSLYSAAQRSDNQHYSVTAEEALANHQFIALANQLQADLRSEDSEDNTSTRCAKTRFTVDQMIAAMSIPLLQNLIHHLVKNNTEHIHLYALAVVPLLEVCRPRDFEDLYEYLVLDVDDYEASDDLEHIVSRLQQSYPCLRVTCDHVGDYRHTYEGTGTSLWPPTCVDPDPLQALAGYTPTSDIQSVSMLDRDILQIQFLLEAEATSLAIEVYQYGSNAIGDDDDNTSKNNSYNSLQAMAVSKTRALVPWTEDFVSYFGGEDSNTYADILIREALMVPSPDVFNFKDASRVQVSQLITNTLSYMVLWMGALEQLYAVYKNCEDHQEGDSDNNGDDYDVDLRPVDKAWAFLSGSLEYSPDQRWRGDGMGLLALARNFGDEFNTLRDNDEAVTTHVHFELIDAFKGLTHSLQQGLCSNAVQRILTIQHLMVVPLIQATLSLAVDNASIRPIEEGVDDFNDGTGVVLDDADLATAFIVSRAHLPIVKAVNATASDVIGQNMDFFITSNPVPDGAATVLHAYMHSGIWEAWKLDCQLVGTHDALGSVCPPEDDSTTNNADEHEYDGDNTSTPEAEQPEIDPTSLVGGAYISLSNVSYV